QQSLHRDAGVVVRALRAIGAILRACTRLDTQQGAQLDAGRVIEPAVDGLGSIHQLRHRKVVNGADLGIGPVVADFGCVCGGMGHAAEYRVGERGRNRGDFSWRGAPPRVEFRGPLRLPLRSWSCYYRSMSSPLVGLPLAPQRAQGASLDDDGIYQLVSDVFREQI